MSYDEMLDHYSRALDEIYALRALCAYTALGIKADLSFKTFPKSRRDVAQQRVDRLQAAARGERISGRVGTTQGKAALEEAGARTTLTRAAWEVGS